MDVHVWSDLSVMDAYVLEVTCHGALFVAKLQVVICHECVVCIEIADCDLSQMCGTDIIREDV